MRYLILICIYVFLVETKEEEFIKAVEEAIAKSGKISRNLAHLMFVGPPEYGSFTQPTEKEVFSFHWCV